jgi:hypothetical protein
MKKSVWLLSISLLLSACGLMKSVDMSRLQMGMSKAQVSSMFGQPDRVLYAGASNGQYEEVLQYTTSRKIYALTFINDQLESYGFISEEIPAGSQVRPSVPHPVYPPPSNGNSSRPNYPSANTNQRPPDNQSGSGSSDRPVNTGRPSATSGNRTGNQGNTRSEQEQSTDGQSRTTTGSSTRSTTEE